MADDASVFDFVGRRAGKPAGAANRLGFAVQLCYLRFPGVILGVEEPSFPPLLKLVADQLKVGVESWDG